MTRISGPARFSRAYGWAYTGSRAAANHAESPMLLEILEPAVGLEPTTC
jgi:hypothetical protein